MIHPAIRDLFQGLGRHAAFQDLLRRLPAHGSVSVSGLTTTAKALYIVMIWQATGRPLVVLADGNKQAEALWEPLETFYDLLVAGSGRLRPQFLPAVDVMPMQAMSPHAEICEQRAVGLWRLASERVPITVLAAPSALTRIHPPEFYRQLALTLRVGDEVPLEDVTAHLASVGYERRDPVEMVGEYSVRGGILDVFSPEAARPVRIDLFGDLVESIRRFDVDTQRSVMKVVDCTLLPLTEYQKSRPVLEVLGEKLRESGMSNRDLPPPGEPFPGWEMLAPMVRPREGSVFDLLENAIVVWDEPELVRAAVERFWVRLSQIERSEAYDPDRIFFTWEGLRARAGATQIAVRELGLETQLAGDGEQGAAFHISTRPAMTFHGNMQVAIAEARTLVEKGNRVAFFGASTGEVERVADILTEYGVAYQLGLEQSGLAPDYLAERAYLAGNAASVYLIRGQVRHGTVLLDSNLIVFGSEDLFDSSELVARAPAPKSGMGVFSPDLIDLKPGDYVVHSEHGVAKYLGLREIVQGEARGDYMLLEYAGETKLYVPLARMDLVERFRGGGEAQPSLDRLGGATWTRTKARVKARMRDMADELLKFYASRKMAEGFRFSPRQQLAAGIRGRLRVHRDQGPVHRHGRD